MDTIYVGIDVSKDRLDVHVLPEPGSFCGRARRQRLGGVDRAASALSPRLIAIEATGGFETIAAAAIAGAALPLAIVNPAQVRHFAQAVGKRAKTDPIDAEVIARFAEAVKPEPRPLPDEQARLLAELVARRRQIIEMIGRRTPAREAGRERAGAQEPGAYHQDARERSCRRSTVTSIRWCAVRRLGAKRKTSWSASRGSSNTLARTFLAELPELGRLSRREIASLAGLAPYTRQSGRWKGKSMIGGGRAALRTALYMAALSASRCNRALKVFYQRLLSAGKPKMVALIAVARKILTILNAMVRDKKAMADRLTKNTVAEVRAKRASG